MSDLLTDNEDHLEPSKDTFHWQYGGRVVVLDNGARLPALDIFDKLMDMQAFATVVFDPASRWHDSDVVKDLQEFQLFPHALLGNGNPATLYACVDPEACSTLAPLAESSVEGGRVLTSLPIGTLKLDAIEGLDHIDWMMLDDRHDIMAVLRDGVRTLSQTLLVSMRISFMAAYEGQTRLDQAMGFMHELGFRFYGFANIKFRNQLPDDWFLEKKQATRWECAEAFFIPDESRLAGLSSERLTKLAFIVDTVHGSHDLAGSLLRRVGIDEEKQYLISRGYVSRYFNEPGTFTFTGENTPGPWENLNMPDPLPVDEEPGS